MRWFALGLNRVWILLICRSWAFFGGSHLARLGLSLHASAPNKVYSRRFLRHKILTPKGICINRFLHEKLLTPEAICAQTILDQITLTIKSVTCRPKCFRLQTCCIKQLLHQKACAPRNIYTRQILRRNNFPRLKFFHRRIGTSEAVLHNRHLAPVASCNFFFTKEFYTKYLLHRQLFRPNTFFYSKELLHQKNITTTIRSHWTAKKILSTNLHHHNDLSKWEIFHKKLPWHDNSWIHGSTW